MHSEFDPDQTPDTILLAFLDALPATIREPTLFKCCFGAEASGFAELALEDKLTILDQYIHKPGYSHSYRCAQLIGVIEVILVGPANPRDDMPLSERHLAQARETFTALRQGPLSPTALSAWQDQLAAENPWVEDAE
jgi:hypothetical protein